MGKWPKQSINLALAPSRGTKDAEGDFDAFISLYGEFAQHFAGLDDDYREDFVQRMNAVLEDFDIGDALRDECADTISDMSGNFSSEDKELLMNALRDEGVLTDAD